MEGIELSNDDTTCIMVFSVMFSVNAVWPRCQVSGLRGDKFHIEVCTYELRYTEYE